MDYLIRSTFTTKIGVMRTHEVLLYRYLIAYVPCYAETIIFSNRSN